MLGWYLGGLSRRQAENVTSFHGWYHEADKTPITCQEFQFDFFDHSLPRSRMVTPLDFWLQLLERVQQLPTLHPNREFALSVLGMGETNQLQIFEDKAGYLKEWPTIRCALAHRIVGYCRILNKKLI